MKFLILCGALALPMMAQTPDHRNVTQLGFWNASGAKQTKPNRAGSSLPGSCTNVETYQLTTTGAIYVCVSGAWKQVSGHWTLSGADLSYTAGSVGIGGGPADSAYKLSVHGQSYFGAPLHSYATSQNNLADNSLVFLKRGNATSSAGAVKDNAELGYIDWYGFGGTGYSRGAMIIALAGGDFSDTSSPGSLNFYTTPVGSTTAVVRSRITAAGKVLVGTSIDYTYGLFAADGDVSIGGYGSQRAYWARGADNAVKGVWFSSLSNSHIGTNSAHGFHLRTSDLDRLSILADGKVGIGKITPATALDVNGTVTATAFAGPLTGNVTGNASGTAANITGTVAIANGGTGATSAANAIAALLPAQSGNGGMHLETNGTTAAWTRHADTKSINLPDPVTGDSGRFHILFDEAVTITRVACSVKAATSVTIQLDERAAATPDTAGTNVLTSSLVCDTNEEVTTSFTNAGIAARVPLALVISAVTGTPDVVRVNISYTRD